MHSKGAKKRLISFSPTPAHTSFVREVSGRLPCLVINLARRPDRLAKVLKDSCDAGMLPLVVNAFDASACSVGISTSTGNDTGNGNGQGKETKHGDRLTAFIHAFQCLAATSGSTRPARAIHECIPEQYVSHTWDSTQNNYFDPTCVVNEATPITQSERCCAASHLAAWLVVDRLREGMLKHKSEDRNGHKNVISQRVISAGEEAVEGVLGDLLGTCAYGQRVFDLCRSGGGWEPLSNDSGSGTDDWYLILEDDAVVAPEYREPVRFRRHLAHLLVSLPSDWDILYLGHAASARGKGRTLKGGLFFKPSYLWQLHGYILRGKAVQTLLSSLPIRGPVDNFLASLIYDGSLCAYSLQRQLIIQEGNLQHRMADSNIHHSGRSHSSGGGQGSAAPWKSMQK